MFVLQFKNSCYALVFILLFYCFKQTMDNLVRFGVSIEPDLLKKFDKFIKEKCYKNGSEAIRDMIRDNLIEDDCKDGNMAAVGTITIVYNHHENKLSDTLTDIQHQYHTSIISTLHVHLDHDNCLEILVVKGKSKKIRGISDKLISTKGVKHGKLIVTTSSEI